MPYWGVGNCILQIMDLWSTVKKFKKSHPRLKFGESAAKSLRERSQPVVTCAKLTIETLEQGAKYIRS